MPLDNLNEENHRRFDAIRAYELAILENPHDATIWNRIGRELTRNREFKFALHAHNKALEINPDSASTWKLKASTLLRLEKYNEAIEACEKALELNPKNLEISRILQKKGEALFQLKRYIEALAEFDGTLQIDLFNSYIWKKKGRTLQYLGRDPEAEECFNNASLNLKSWKTKIFNEFVEGIKYDRRNEDPLIISILKARGFFIEKNSENKFFVSDNSFYDPECYYGDDPSYLNKLLKEVKIGYVKNNEICFEKVTESINYETLFFRFDSENLSSYSSDIGEFRSSGSWNNFQKDMHRRTIPIKVLDPFIARLIKSMSAIGVFTDMSCDQCRFSQHHYNNSFSNTPWIAFSGSINAAYFNALLDLVVKPRIELKCNWDITEKNKKPKLEISSQINSSTSLSMLYREIQTVACLFYENRKVLREMKQEVVKKCDRYNASYSSFDRYISNYLKKESPAIVVC